MWKTTDDGSVIDSSGDVIYFSFQRFLSDIILGKGCFLCGRTGNGLRFTDEHIIPNWLLRKFDLHHVSITLPNDTTIQYSRYKIRCCEHCNSKLGSEIEVPISRAFATGLDGINNFVSSPEGRKLFLWMSLIFLKTHLRDRKYRVHQDFRLGDQSISDEYEYEWHQLHHSHCLVRCVLNGGLVNPSAFGSIAVWPAKTLIAKDKFDYADFSFGYSMMIRLDDICVWAVLNDSGAASANLSELFQRIPAPINDLQSREILVEFTMMNLLLKKRPEFFSKWNKENKNYEIDAILPQKLELEEYDMTQRGELLSKILRHAEKSIRLPNKTPTEVSAQILSGKFTLLSDEMGKL